MAKNILEQLLTLAGEAWSGTKVQKDFPTYYTDDDESSGLTGVEKYMAKQARAEKAAAVDAGATGVAKYLAKQALAEKEKAGATEAKAATGVAKYLAKQGTVKKATVKKATAPATGVEKYMAKQVKTGKGKTSPRKAKAAVKQGKSAAEKITKQAKPVKKNTPKPTANKRVEKQAKPVKKDPPKAAEKKVENQPKPAKKTTPKTTGTVMLSENATQCQASTAKGTQCARTSNLTHIQRTINKLKYQFAVCSQHNNDTFKPFADLIKN